MLPPRPPRRVPPEGERRRSLSRPAGRGAEVDEELREELGRLRGENAALREVLDGNGVQDLEALKMELCDTLRRRGRLENAVRARHEGLQRALCQPLQQALADGAAAVQVAETTPSAGGRRPWGVGEVLELEEQVFKVAEALDGSLWAMPLRKASSELLRHAPDLPDLAVVARMSHP